jgi:hypothetical protein
MIVREDVTPITTDLQTQNATGFLVRMFLLQRSRLNRL